MTKAQLLEIIQNAVKANGGNERAQNRVVESVKRNLNETSGQSMDDIYRNRAQNIQNQQVATLKNIISLLNDILADKGQITQLIQLVYQFASYREQSGKEQWSWINTFNQKSRDFYSYLEQVKNWAVDMEKKPLPRPSLPTKASDRMANLATYKDGKFADMKPYTEY